MKFLLNKKCWHPKYWLLALVLLIFWCLSRLPYKVQLALGRRFGRVVYFLSAKTRTTTRAQVTACFPAMVEEERERFVEKATLELGCSIFETFLIWFRDNEAFLCGRVTVEGESNWKHAMASGRGVIMLSSHFGCVDLNAALAARLDRGGKAFVATFRQTDGVINDLLASVRAHICDELVSATNQRSVVRALKLGNIVWYAPDIEVAGKNAAFVPFFGVQASTTLAIARLAKATGALVLPVAHYRSFGVDGQPQYLLKVLPAIIGTPSESPIEDTHRVNLAIEEMIAPDPACYWWAIKRFKRRPKGEASIYTR